jgi:hypothetical protein
LSHRARIEGSDVEQKGSAMRRSGWLSSRQLIATVVRDERQCARRQANPGRNRSPRRAKRGLYLDYRSRHAHKGRLWAANNSDREAAFNFTLSVTTGEGQQ